MQGRSQDFGSGGGREASNKIFSNVDRTSVRGGDIQQKFTQQRLLKNFGKIYIKFAQKFKKFSKNLSGKY